MLLLGFTTFGHCSLGLLTLVLALGFAYTISASTLKRSSVIRFSLLTVVVHNFADLDSLTYLFGATHHDIYGHRGISHSLFAGTFVAGMAAWIMEKEFSTPASSRRFAYLFSWFYFSFALHVTGDMLCDTDDLVAWGWPFLWERQQFAYRPIPNFSFRLDDGAVHAAYLVELRMMLTWIGMPGFMLLSLMLVSKAVAQGFAWRMLKALRMASATEAS